MLQSMTGYVAKTVSFKLDEKSSISIDLTLKSLNSKYFECNNRLPHIFYSLENEIIRILKKELKRGTVYLYANISGTGLKTRVDISFDALDGYMNALNEVKQRYNITDSVKISDLLRIPNIFVADEENLTDEQKALFLDVIKGITVDLIKERIREGLELKQDIIKRIDFLRNNIKELAKEFEIYFKNKQLDTANKLSENLVNDAEFAEIQRKIMYTVLDKIDINEEIVRFNAHLKNLQDIIENPEIEKGKTLDFTLQELAREINTILAKTTSVEVSNIGLTIKVEIEKTREQVQNLV